jgi:hypothetical protein
VALNTERDISGIVVHIIMQETNGENVSQHISNNISPFHKNNCAEIGLFS